LNDLAAERWLGSIPSQKILDRTVEELSIHVRLNEIELKTKKLSPISDPPPDVQSAGKLNRMRF